MTKQQVEDCNYTKVGGKIKYKTRNAWANKWKTIFWVMERVKVKVVMETLIRLFLYFFFNYELSLLIVSKSMGILNPIN